MEILEALFSFALISFILSFIIGLIILLLANLKQEKQINTDELFFYSIIGGTFSGLIGGLLGHYLGLKFASQVDGMFIGLSGIGEVINYFQIFLPCWILSTLGGAMLAVIFSNKDTK